MAEGVTLEFDNQSVLRQLRRALDVVEDPTPIFRDLGEELLIIHQDRFRAQQSPDGKAWKPLSPRYKRRKKKNKDKILVLEGFLRDTLRWQASASGLAFGTNRPTGRWHQLGGGNNPIREWLGVGRQDEPALNRVVERQLRRAFA